MRLATTDRNADELQRKLVEVLGLTEAEAAAEAGAVLAVFEIILADEYEHARAAAADRLDQGGRSDWPALAAALAMDGAIWSDDRDFFGVGVPVWSSRNVCHLEPVA